MVGKLGSEAALNPQSRGAVGSVPRENLGTMARGRLNGDLSGKRQEPKRTRGLSVRRLTGY